MQRERERLFSKMRELINFTTTLWPLVVTYIDLKKINDKHCPWCRQQHQQCHGPSLTSTE